MGQQCIGGEETKSDAEYEALKKQVERTSSGKDDTKQSTDSIDVNEVNKLRCYKQINLASLRHNITAIQKMASATNCEQIAVLKANAYGHGAVRVAHECLKQGINTFATATISEAIELRQSNQEMMASGVRIIVLGASVESEYELYAQHRIDLMLSSPEATESLIAWCKAHDNRSVDVHLMVDTGMSRIGFQLEDCLDRIVDIYQNGQEYGLKFVGLCTHFASALDKEYTNIQFQRITTVLDRLSEKNVNVEIFHVESSNVLMADVIDDDVVKSYLDHDTKGYVRTGGALYGIIDESKQELETMMSLHARIRQVEEIKKGEPVGYDASFVAEEDVLIATLSIGYADGVPRGLSNAKQCVRIGDYLYDVAGRVAMDMMMVNLGNAEQSPHIKEIKIGDYAVLFGPKHEHPKNILIPELLKVIGGQYNEYQITCGISQRCATVFVD